MITIICAATIFHKKKNKIELSCSEENENIAQLGLHKSVVC